MVLKYSVRPRARGICERERGWVEVEGPLGLLSRRERIASGGATRVYPDTEAFITGGFRLPGERGTTAGYESPGAGATASSSSSSASIGAGTRRGSSMVRPPASYEGR